MCFETSVNPTTVSMKALRIQSATNVAPTETPTAPCDSEKLEKLEKTWGGARAGSGRKGKTSESDDPFIEVPVAPDDSCEDIFPVDPVAETHEELATGKGSGMQPSLHRHNG